MTPVIQKFLQLLLGNIIFHFEALLPFPPRDLNATSLEGGSSPTLKRVCHSESESCKFGFLPSTSSARVLVTARFSSRYVGEEPKDFLTGVCVSVNGFPAFLLSASCRLVESFWDFCDFHPPWGTSFPVTWMKPSERLSQVRSVLRNSALLAFWHVRFFARRSRTESGLKVMRMRLVVGGTLELRSDFYRLNVSLY